jgi:hypothetical protein
LVRERSRVQSSLAAPAFPKEIQHFAKDTLAAFQNVRDGTERENPRKLGENWVARLLRQAQFATSRGEEQDRLSRGIYITAVAAREEMARIPRRIVDAFDGAIPEFAAALAAKWQIPARDATHLLRAEFRRTRTRMAQEFAALAAEGPEFIEHDLDDDRLTTISEGKFERNDNNQRPQRRSGNEKADQALGRHGLGELGTVSDAAMGDAGAWRQGGERKSQLELCAAVMVVRDHQP